jgi:hypothetical protein
MGDRKSRRSEHLNYINELLAAGVRASNLGHHIVGVDTQAY